MAYLGTPPRSRVLSSADIGTGAVTLDDISFTDQPTSVNVSGAINKHTMRLSDQVVIDGDLTITDNLILSKISDDGNAITLTNDSSTRTITGTGSLEASTLTQTPNASLTGMTGELGSVITGSPNLNLTTGTLGSGVTFPAGQVLQTVFAKNGTEAASTGFNLVTAVAGSISLSNASNKIVVWTSTPCVYQTYGGSSNTSGSVYGGFQHVSSGTGVSAETKVWGSWYSGQGLYGFGWSSGSTDEKFLKTIATFVWTFTPGTTNATTITLQAAGYGDHTMSVNYQGGSSPYHKESLMVLQEIQV